MSTETGEGQQFLFNKSQRELSIPIQEIERIGRRRHRLHVTIARGQDFFSICPRLIGEDLHDLISDRVSELENNTNSA